MPNKRAAHPVRSTWSDQPVASPDHSQPDNAWHSFMESPAHGQPSPAHGQPAYCQDNIWQTYGQNFPRPAQPVSSSRRTVHSVASPARAITARCLHAFDSPARGQINIGVPSPFPHRPLPAQTNRWPVQAVEGPAPGQVISCQSQSMGRPALGQTSQCHDKNLASPAGCQTRPWPAGTVASPSFGETSPWPDQHSP
jgi:hypothetical protein